MTQSQALNQLMDAADLVALLEEVTRPGSAVQLNTNTVSGLRVTLRTVREILLDSHDMLAKAFVEKVRQDSPAVATSPNAESAVVFKRKDLRSALLTEQA